jgi:hypothetical protein
MNLYIFGSVNLTNIWAGIGARRWAISVQQAENVSGAVRKAADMQIGSLGIIYCSETQVFTTPFLVASKPDPAVTISDIWPEPWTLPFRVLPLGTPRKQLHKDHIKSTLPSLRHSTRQWNRLLLVTPTTVFVPSQIEPADWEALMIHLADDVEG